MLAFSTATNAQYKCTNSTGGVSFQQFPCSTNAKQQALNVRVTFKATPVEAMASSANMSKAQPTELERIKAANSSMEKERKIREIEYKIANIEQVIGRRNAQMSAEVNALRKEKRRASNNLAGATWEQSLSAEMQAITQKYQAVNQLDIENIKALRSELLAWQGQK
jgi:predicted GTPase